MPPKGKGGNKHRKQAKGNAINENRVLLMKEENQEYALVTKLLGGNRVETQCFDGVLRQSLIRGNMRKKIWINVGDLILVSLRDFQDGKGDVIHKYSPEDARQLKKIGELPENTILSQQQGKLQEQDTHADEILFDFEDI